MREVEISLILEINLCGFMRKWVILLLFINVVKEYVQTSSHIESLDLEIQWLGKFNLYEEYVSWNSSFEIAFLVAKDGNVST